MTETQTPKNHISLPVVGGQYRHGYDWKSLRIGHPVTLRADPCGKITGDKHKDPTALAVYDSSGKHFGYIPKEFATLLAPAILEGSIEVTAAVKWIVGPSNIHIDCVLQDK